MKWWGWGEPGTEFTHLDKPALASFIADAIDVDVTRVTDPPTAFEQLQVPPSQLGAELRRSLADALGDEFVSVEDLDRVVHARGKSLRDLVRQRRGELPRVPDVVVRPGSEAEVEAVMKSAVGHDAVLIAFGGGSSISGSLEPPHDEERPVISIDLARLDRVLDVDAYSRLARVQAGVYGPALEAQLTARGFTFGHFPDSFSYSTLGGWIATRSSGMQSDRYGDIADLTKGLRVVTPCGMLVVRPVPAMSTGPSVRQMVLGSEGRLGIITEATVHVRPTPGRRTILGYLFPNFADAVGAMRDLAASDCSVSVSRVSDAPETRFSFAMRSRPTALDRLQSFALRAYLSRRRRWDVGQMCLAFVGYEGSAGHVAAQRKAAGRLIGHHGGLCIGEGPGALYDQKKFDTPHIRDYLLDRGAIGDVSETATTWGQLLSLYDAVTHAGHEAFAGIGVRGYLMCHLSHSYHAGACLYFTFAFRPTPARDMLEDYSVVKSAIQQAFVDSGATLSHHHAVGTEHAEWLEQDISPPGVAMLEALFEGTDPGRNLNPGKIVGTPSVDRSLASPRASARNAASSAAPMNPLAPTQSSPPDHQKCPPA